MALKTFPETGGLRTTRTRGSPEGNPESFCFELLQVPGLRVPSTLYLSKESESNVAFSVWTNWVAVSVLSYWGAGCPLKDSRRSLRAP